MGGRGTRRRRRPWLVACLAIFVAAVATVAAGPSRAAAPDPRDAPAEPSPRPPAGSSAGSSVGTELLSESFEDIGFPPPGWTYAPVGPPPHRWLRTTEAANVYAGAAAAVVRWSDAAAPDELLFATPLSFAAHVSTDSGQSWQRIFSIHDLTDTGWAWRNGVVDLSGLVGSASVQIRFRYWGLGAADVALDDIRVGTTSGGPPANDDCAGALAGNFRVGPASGTVVLAGDNRLATHDYPLSASGCTGYAHVGRDLVWIVEVPPGHRFQAVMDASGDWDDTLFLVGDCADPEGTCVDGDRGLPDGATVVWVNVTGVAQELRLVASGHGTAAGEFTISATIEPEVSIEPGSWGRVKAGWRAGGGR